MRVLMPSILLIVSLLMHNTGFSQTSKPETITLTDIVPDKISPAGTIELTILSDGSLISAMLYKANGQKKHPILIMLHGLPGYEKNLDLAQVVRNHGWNVLYFNYRGSWGCQGEFSFKNCVADAENVITYAKKYADSLQIDTSNIVLFGHSMGGWVCLKLLQQPHNLKKGIAISAMNMPTVVSGSDGRSLSSREIAADKMFVLKIKSGKDLFAPLKTDSVYFDLSKDAKSFSGKQIIMLDENSKNKQLAEVIGSYDSLLEYEIWQTDHPFTDKRVALMKKVLTFLDK